MRFTVEAWSPEYGAPTESEPREPGREPDVDVELPASQWRAIAPDMTPAPDILFVDGVRRVDANLWIEQSDGAAEMGLCATYAAGAVRCNGAAEIVEASVERGLFTSASGAADVETRHGSYWVKATTGTTPPELWLGIQQRMGELEGRVAFRHRDSDLIVVDGPLSHHQQIPGAVGYVKTHHVQYLPPELRPVMAGLPAGRRTPLFLVTGHRSAYSWYLRLAVAPGPTGGIVRCEVSADRTAAEAALIADRVSVTLPRFASHEHKDPRAPQNLYPIGGLERELRRRLGDPRLLYRALREASAATSGVA
ncbi:MAG: hypothetical protein OEX04_03780 [Acidimicrobiia bacterium]|nr:hypothetical protein [Acidimicrobiia bacterium]MDH4306576.1 hypothetical protein [Acidimicrobiia bacterium]